MSRFSSIFLFFYTICLIFVFIQVSRGETCENPIYQRFSTNHTACKKDNIQCHKTKAGVSEDDIQTILRVHNEYRNRIAAGKEKEQYKFPSAANMMQLVWDQELADIAQSHANQCDFNHDCNNCRETDDFQVGQNLYQRKTSWLQPVANWTKAIKSFYDEISFTPTKVLSKFKGGAYGHFTQVVWATTWKIGCGYAAYPPASNGRNESSIFKTEELYVCNYGPSGNLRGQKMYRKGAPTAKCPYETSPSDDYDSLCKANGPSGPEEFNRTAIITSDKTLFFCDFSNDSICGLQIRHQNNSFLVDGLLHDYLSFILTQKQQIAIQFPGSYQAEEGLCFQSFQRKGPNDALHDSSHKLMIKLAIPELSWSTELEFGKDSNEWIRANVNINWPQKTNLTITFEVPEGAEEQFYEIQRLLITKGRCAK